MFYALGPNLITLQVPKCSLRLRNNRVSPSYNKYLAVGDSVSLKNIQKRRPDINKISEKLRDRVIRYD